MILLAAMLVATAAVLALFGAITGELGWLYGAITVSLSALLVLAAGVVRATRGASGAGTQDPAAGSDTGDTDPGAPPS